MLVRSLLLLGGLWAVGALSAQAQPFGLRGTGLERLRLAEDGDRDGRTASGYASADIVYRVNLETGSRAIELLGGVSDLDGELEPEGRARPLFPVALDAEGGLGRLRYRVLWPGPEARPVAARLERWSGASERAETLWLRVAADWHGQALVVLEVRDTMLNAAVRMEVLLQVRCTDDGPPRVPLVVIPENSPGLELDLSSLEDPDGPYSWLPLAEGLRVSPDIVLLPRPSRGEDPFVGLSVGGTPAGVRWDGMRARLRIAPGALRAHTGPPERGYSVLRLGYRNGCPADTLWAELRIRVEGENEAPRISDGRPGPVDWTGVAYPTYDNRPPLLLGPRALAQGSEAELLLDLLDGRRSGPLLRPAEDRAGPNGSGPGWSLFYDVETPAELLRYRFQLERRQLGLRVGVTGWVERHGEPGLEVQLLPETRLRLRLGSDWHTDFDRDGVLDTLVVYLRAEDDGRSNGRWGLRGGAVLPLEETSFSTPRSAVYAWMLQVRPRGAAVGSESEAPEPLSRRWSLYPNPTRGPAWVLLSGPWRGEGELMLYDALGRRLWRQTFQAHPEARLELPCSAYPPGLYVLRLRVGQEEHVRPLVVVR
ncbi:MAG: T9SS type A sorting domain-containing protein [Bacteroidota bacterium]|nr:T9SS type A sorting domain-containing protein [Bacteroidota bacterium]